jgi:hypothetical protein
MRCLFGLAVAAFVAVAACGVDRENFYRGGVNEIMDVAPGDLASVYRAALGGSLTISDPRLWVLVDTMFLPRTEGLAGGVPIPSEHMAAIRRLDVVKGTCTVPVQSRQRAALVCQASYPGYAARFSQPFALGPDSVQVHVVLEQYAIPGGPQLERLRFERAYHVVKRGGSWRAAREGRFPQP